MGTPFLLHMLPRSASLRTFPMHCARTADALRVGTPNGEGRNVSDACCNLYYAAGRNACGSKVASLDILHHSRTTGQYRTHLAECKLYSQTKSVVACLLKWTPYGSSNYSTAGGACGANATCNTSSHWISNNLPYNSRNERILFVFVNHLITQVKKRIRLLAKKQPTLSDLTRTRAATVLQRRSSSEPVLYPFPSWCSRHICSF